MNQSQSIVQKSNITKVKDFLHRNYGLSFTESQNKELSLKLASLAKHFNFSDTDKFIGWITEPGERSKMELEEFISFLTIGETYFFRDRDLFEYIEKEYLPELIRKRANSSKRIRIWSAGCSSGEEAYTIAILIQKLIPNIDSWNIKILASDINVRLLKKAKEGIYTEWSFRKLSPAFKQRYFEKTDKDQFKIKPQIAKMVDFTYHNLVETNYPGLDTNTNAMDLIFCRNVFIYFNSETIKTVANKLYKSLVKNGILVVSPVEVSSLLSSKFARIKLGDMTIYQKATSDTIKHQVIKNTPSPTNFKINHATSYPFTEKKHLLPKDPLQIIKNSKPKATNKESEKIVKGSATEPVVEFKLTLENASKLYNEGSFEELANLFKNIAFTNNSDSNRIAKLLIKSKANIGKLDEALETCNRAQNCFKFDDEIYFLKASILEEQSKTSDAVAALKATIYLNPQNPLAHFSIANLYFKTNQHEKAKKHYSNSSKILQTFSPEEIVPESEGMTVKDLLEISERRQEINQ